MNRTTNGTQAASPIGRSYVSDTDGVLKFLEDAIKSDGGTIVVTTETDPTTGSEYLNIEISGSGEAIAVATETGRVKVTASGSTLQYLEDVLSGVDGIKATFSADSIEISLDADLNDLNDVDTGGAEENSILTMDGAGDWVTKKIIVDGTATDLGTTVDEQDAEVPTRQMVNEYIANLQFGTIDGGGDNYDQSSMWTSRWISHMEMWFAKHTTGGSNTGFTAPVVSTDTRVVATDAGYVEFNAFDTSIGIVPNGAPGVVAGHALFNHPIEEDYFNSDAVPKIYVDLALSNDASAIAGNVPCDIRLVAIALNNEEDVTSAARIVTVDETVTWLTALGLAKYLQYHTFEIDAASLTLAIGDILRFDVSVELQAGQDVEVHILGARLRYKTKQPKVRTADTIVTTNP